MKLFYRETGKGIPVIIIHGLFGCSDNWMHIAGILSEKYRVIAIDCRNHGNSPYSGTQTYSEMVTDLDWLFHELKINISVLRANLDQIMSGMDITDFEDRLPMTNYPVLFLRGGLSDYIQESDYPVILRMYPQAIISTIEGTTHLLHVEKPDEFASIYLNFLKTVH
jgi:pimeloyl-ACP methyl ester carboxylesterase